VVGSMTKMKDNDIPWGKMHWNYWTATKYTISILYNFLAYSR
jgi:hypothetical protein